MGILYARVRAVLATIGALGAALVAAAPAAGLVPGDFDPSFGSSGLILSHQGATNVTASVANAMTLQPDGKILLAGYATNGAGDESFAVQRLNADGSTDPTWNGGATVLARGGIAAGSSMLANAVAVQPANGAIVLAGQANNPFSNFTLMRLTSTGAPDPSFTTYSAALGGSSSAAANAVAVEQNGGNVIAAGSASLGGLNQLAVADFTSAGALAPSFNGGSPFVKSMGLGATPSSRANALVLQPDGKIILVGEATDMNNAPAVLVARLNTSFTTPAGAMDPAFNGGNAVITQLSAGAGGDSDATAVALQPDGKIVVAGYASTAIPTNHQLFVMRLNANGSADPTFNNGQPVFTQPSTGAIAPNTISASLALQPDGKIVVAGTAKDPGGHPALFVARFTAGGSTDASWNGGKTLLTQPSLSLDNNPWTEGQAVAVQPSGKILVAGDTFDTTDTQEFLVGRLIADLAPISTFSTSAGPFFPGGAVSFSGKQPATPYDPVTGYAWNFGDGATAGGINVSHTYAKPGTYTVALTVTDVFGLTSTSQSSLTVDAGSPTSIVSASTSGNHLTLTLACGAGAASGACAGPITVTSHEAIQAGKPVAVAAKRHKKKKTIVVTVATGSYSGAPGKTVTVGLTLGSTGQSLLDRFYRLPATVKVGAQPSSTKTVTFSYGRIRSPIFFTWLFNPSYSVAQKLTVTGLPAKATITLICHGGGCPFAKRALSPKGRQLALAADLAHAHLKVHATLDVEITAANDIGKVATFTILSGGAPSLTERCLPPGARRPTACAH